MIRTTIRRGWRALVAEDPVAARIALAYAVVQLLVIGWDMPGAWGWENDGIAPRDFLAGVANNLSGGNGHRYPLLHNFIVALACLPVLVATVMSANGLDFESIRTALLTPAPMTACALIIRTIAVFFSTVTVLTLARITRRLFGATAGRWAAVVVAVNVSCSYYGRTSNLDGPYLMWTVVAVDRLLTIGEHQRPRDYGYFALFVAAAVATKDQAYATFVLLGPIYLLLLPWSKTTTLRTGWAIGIGAAAYAVLSAAAFNPTGFLYRIRLLTGPNAQDWRVYPRTFEGLTSNLADLFFAQEAFWWPWPVVIVAWAGVVYVIGAGRGAEPGNFRPDADNGVPLWWWRLAPFVAGLSSLAAFTLVVGRTEHRFALPLGMWLSVYAGVLLSRAAGAHRAGRVAAIGLVAWAMVPPAALIATQLTDSRWAVTRWLASRPQGTTVEVYGKVVYLPQLDVGPTSPYRVQRVDRSSPRRRDPIVGADELRGSGANPGARAADVLIVPEPWTRRFQQRPNIHGVEQSKISARAQADEEATRYFRQVRADDVPGYRTVTVGANGWPDALERWGIRPVAIHGSTAERIWVLTSTAP